MQAVLDRTDTVTETSEQGPSIGPPDTIGLWDAETDVEVWAVWYRRKSYAQEVRWHRPANDTSRATHVKGYMVFDQRGRELRRVVFGADCKRMGWCGCESGHHDLWLAPGDTLVLSITWDVEGMRI